MGENFHPADNRELAGRDPGESVFRRTSEMVLGEHALRGGIYGPDPGDLHLPQAAQARAPISTSALAAAILHLPGSCL